MFRIKWLNILLIFGNTLGQYRNYSKQKSFRRILIFLHISVQTTMHFITLLYELYILLRGDVDYQMNIIYAILTVTSLATAIISVVSSISCSENFLSYVESVNRVHRYFGDDKTVSSSLKRLCILSVFLILISIVFAILRSGTVIIKFFGINDVLTIGYAATFYSQIFVRITILYQKILTFVVILLIVILTKSFNSLILSVHEKVIQANDINEVQRFDFITKEVIQEWLELYLDLANCCERVIQCFGRQFLFALVMAVLYYILLTYQVCYLNIQNAGDQIITLVIVVYILYTTLSIVAGQWAHDQWNSFHRNLARLYNAMLILDSKEDEMRLIKDFIRVVKKHPLEIKLMSKVPAGMYILPTILTLTINYIIVMLQFNNIV